jgi:hypothetical protein
VKLPVICNSSQLISGTSSLQQYPALSTSGMERRYVCSSNRIVFICFYDVHFCLLFFSHSVPLSIRQRLHFQINKVNEVTSAGGLVNPCKFTVALFNDYIGCSLYETWEFIIYPLPTLSFNNPVGIQKQESLPLFLGGRDQTAIYNCHLYSSPLSCLSRFTSSILSSYFFVVLSLLSPNLTFIPIYQVVPRFLSTIPPSRVFYKYVFCFV